MLILQGPNHPVEALTFAPDSVALYAVQGHHGIRAWNLADRTATRAECEGRLLVAQYVFHPGGRWAFSRTAHTRPPDYNGALAIELVSGTARPFNAYGPPGTVAFRSDGGMVTVGYDRSKWDPVSGTPRSFLYLCWWTMGANGPALVRQRELPEHEGILFIVTLGDRFATVESLWSHATQEQVGRLTIRRGSDGEPETHFPFPHAPPQQLRASPDGTVLVARSGAELTVWDTTDWTRPPVLVKCSQNATPHAAEACFHPSGRFLFLANGTSSVLLFDVTTWRQVQAWKWGAGRLQSVAVSTDGTLAAAGSQTGAIVIWDLDL